MIQLVFGAENWDDLFLVRDYATQTLIKIIQLTHFLVDKTFLARDRKNGRVACN
jgi:hypothetical protein